MKSIFAILIYISILLVASIGIISAENADMKNETMNTSLNTTSNGTDVQTNVTTNVIPSIITNFHINSVNVFVCANTTEIIDILMHQNMTI